MTVLLYIFAMIGAVVTVGGIIAMGFDISQSRDDMAYWIHTRFPEFEKEVNAKLYTFEEKLKKPLDEIYIEKDAYDLDWHEIQEELRVIDNRLDNHEKVFVTRNDYSRQTEEFIQRCDEIAKKTGDYNIRFTRNAASLKDIHERLNTAFHEISELSDRTVILKNRLDEDDAVINSLRDKVHKLDQRMMNDMLDYIPKTITGNSPHDIHLTEITVGDDPNQMSKGTTV